MSTARNNECTLVLLVWQTTSMQKEMQAAGQSLVLVDPTSTRSATNSFKQLCHLKEHLQKVHRVAVKTREGR